MVILETARLVVRELTLGDDAFIVALLNTPGFREYIGDKGVRSAADARVYLRTGPLASYAVNGFGLWLVALRDGGTPIGICGILRRPGLDHADLGFALLPEFEGQGYAFEAASAVLAHARSKLHLDPILAVTAFRNPRSVKLLTKLGFEFVRFIDLPGHAEPSRLFIFAIASHEGH